MKINCLVQVTGNNELDFTEWLDYHIALGFTAIYVFDAGNKVWLDSVCEKRRDRVVRVPRSDEWQYKSSIIKEYLARVHNEEWCVCLDDHDFIYINPNAGRNIREYIAKVPERAVACTLYTKHMSSEKPMKNRVGTQIDCFLHGRKEPEGFAPAYKVLPNTGITFFKITGPNMPMKNAIVPVQTNLWVDAMMSPLSEQRLVSEMSSRQYTPMRYPARCYRYALRSGIEMEFNNEYVPVGFNVLDLSMQKAREQYLRIPVNQETEQLFAKDTIPEPSAQVESVNGTTYEISAEELAERSLPITKARIAKLILKGQYFEDICKYVSEKYGDFDKEALERVFNYEREAIIKSSTMYTQVQEMLDEGKSDKEIKAMLVLTDTTLEHMKAALAVLDIHTNVKPVSATGAEALDLAAGITVTTENDTALTEAFNATVDANKMTAVEKEMVETIETKAREKRKSKKNRTQEKSSSTVQPKKKVVAVKAIAMNIAEQSTATDDDDEFTLNVGGTDEQNT